MSQQHGAHSSSSSQIASSSASTTSLDANNQPEEPSEGIQLLWAEDSYVATQLSQWFFWEAISLASMSASAHGLRRLC